MAPTRRPSSIRIGMYTWSISWDEAAFNKELVALEDFAGINGVTDIEQQTIVMNPKVSRDAQREYLLHEIMHACFFVGGLISLKDEPEEQFITVVAPVLCLAMMQNPHVFKWITTPAKAQPE